MYVGGIKSGVLWLLHNTAYRVLLLMSEVLKVTALYSVYSGLSSQPGGKAIV